METRHRDLIRSKYRELMDEIKQSVEDVTKTLWRNKIISKHMEEDVVEANNTNRKRAMALLDLIPTRGPNAFEALYEAVLEAELFTAADILKPEFAPHQVQTPRNEEVKKNSQAVEVEDVSSDEELPDNWPSDSDAVTKVKLKKIEDKSKQQKLYLKSLTAQGQHTYYTMKHKVRGRALVINQEKFEDTSKTLKDRDGTVKDRMAIEKLFQGLGFNVYVLSNKTKQEMWDDLVKESKMDHSNYDCFVLFILSHGYYEVVFGIDGEQPEGGTPSNYITIKDITDLFCNVKSLKSKPKLFFIQACQGTQKDPGFGAGDKVDGPLPKKEEQQDKLNDGSDESMDSTENKKFKTPVSGASPMTTMETADQEGDIDLQKTKKTLDNILPSEASDAAGDKIPTRADVFLAMATTPGMLSWRNTKHGTWFIQAIVYIFSKYAYKHELNRLMTITNRLVSKAETSSGKFKQIGEKKDTLQKTFYFFPGQYFESV